MLSRFLAGLFFVLVASPLLAQQPFPADADDVATSLPAEKSVVAPKAEARLTISVPNVPGVYTLTIVAGGRPTLAVQPEIIVLDPDAPPGPTPVPPVPGVLTDRAKAIKAAAEKATGDAKRGETASGLAGLYREIALSCKAPATVENVSNVVLRFTDTTTGHQNATAAWEPFRETLRGHLVAMIQEGKSVEQIGKYLSDEAAAGLEASVPKQADAKVYKTEAGTSISGISPEFWAFLKELLMMLLPLLLNAA